MHPLLTRFPDSRKQSFQTYFHPDCLLHEGPPEHPERPERLQAVLKGCMTLPQKTPVAFVIPTPASFEQLLWIHGMRSAHQQDVPSRRVNGWRKGNPLLR